MAADKFLLVTQSFYCRITKSFSVPLKECIKTYANTKFMYTNGSNLCFPLVLLVSIAIEAYGCYKLFWLVTAGGTEPRAA